MWKTDYPGIHEQQYEQIRKSDRSGWSSDSAVQEMCSVVEQGLEKHGAVRGKLLELGCGDGSVALALASAGFDVHGIDIVPMAISWAREKALESGVPAQFQVGSVIDLPYREGSFDVVFDADCSHCIIGDDRESFFLEASRVTKSDGLFIMVALCGEPAPELQKDFDPRTRCVVRDGVAGRYIGLPEEIVDEAIAAGLDVLEWRTVKSEDQDEEIVMYCVKREHRS